MDNINLTQGGFRDQIAALIDLNKQIVGDASTEPGASVLIDPLSAPFVLYVNPYTGSDKFAAGSYNSYEPPGGSSQEDVIAAVLKRVEKQRLTWLHSSAAFKTVNRAAIEVAIITSKIYFAIGRFFLSR